jgi:outer membrane receptor protein involved in Fe transport
VTARVANVTDEIYAPWSDVFYLQQNDPGFLYANQIMLASPRTFEISVEFTF